MSFEHSVKIPIERVGVLVGRGGDVKKDIEEQCGVQINVNSKEGEITIRGIGDLSKMEPFRAVELVNAIAKGFSPQRASRLLREEDCTLGIVDLREYSGRSKSTLDRIKGRIIGLKGKARRTVEELTGGRISVYGHTVGIIGTASEVEMARDAIAMLASGKPHQNVYNGLQKQRAKMKLERLQLWEGHPIGQ